MPVFEPKPDTQPVHPAIKARGGGAERERESRRAERDGKGPHGAVVLFQPISWNVIMKGIMRGWTHADEASQKISPLLFLYLPLQATLFEIQELQDAK